MGALLELITGPAGKYLIGALILAAVVGGSWHLGAASERGKQAEVTLEKTRKQAILDKKHRDLVAAATAENQALANRIEVESNAARSTIESMAEDNRRLAARTAGRLRDPNARACPVANGMPKAGDTARAADSAADGAFISESLSRLLIREFERADKVGAYAATCFAFVRGLNP